MAKYRLFAPGPTPVPESVRLRMAQEVLHHRTPAFGLVVERVRDGLRWLFQTQQEVICLSGTGTAAMDSAVCNFLSHGNKAIVVNGGKFGERWTEILRAYGCEPIEVMVEWGKAVDPEAIEMALKAHPDARAVYMQACETSTGVSHPFREIAAICRDRLETLCIVDGITAVGVSDVAQDRDGIDVLISGSQKAFMLPPGLAFVGVSEKAWYMARRANLPKFYLNLAAERKAAAKNQSAYTSSVSLMMGLDESLRLLKQEGLNNIFARHERLATITRAGLEGMGCQLFAETPANGVTAAYAPQNLDTERLVRHLRDTYNMTIAEGQDAYKGKTFRVAHMGYFDDVDMLTLIATLETAFADLGVDIQMGQGSAAAARAMRGHGA